MPWKGHGVAQPPQDPGAALGTLLRARGLFSSSGLSWERQRAMSPPSTARLFPESPPPSGPGSGKLKSRVTLAVSSFSRVLCWVLSQA